MKNMLLTMGLLFVINAHADIEYTPEEQSNVSQAEVTKNRACFQELNVQGCGDPGEDPIHFRSCMKNVKDTLSASCRSKMTELYGK